MPPQAITAVLSQRVNLTEDTFELHLQLQNPSELLFRAGQFLNIKIEDGNPKIFFRSYSIMSRPSEKNTLKLCIRLVPTGRATPWLATVSEGTTINMMGAFGRFTFNEASEKNSVFVATGTGIAPLRCMIEDQLEKGNTHSMHLIWGNRYEKDIFYIEELQALADKYPNFTYTITISRPEELWTGGRGRVTELLEKKDIEPNNTQVYICGVGDMVTDTVSICEKIRLPAEDVHYERYD